MEVRQASDAWRAVRSKRRIRATPVDELGLVNHATP
jgi:hypothetical protein